MGISCYLCRFISLALVSFITFVSIAFSQLNYTEFSSGISNQLSFLGDSAINGNFVRLISAQNGGGKAAVWHKTKHQVTDGFVTMFNFRIINGNGPKNGSYALLVQLFMVSSSIQRTYRSLATDFAKLANSVFIMIYKGLAPKVRKNPKNGGADGFVFVVQNYSTDDPGGIGGSGGNIGYGADSNPQVPALGIPYSIAIEFDTYLNDTLNDPDNNHISVHNVTNTYFNNANEDYSIARTSTGSIPALRDGNIHTARIEYDGATGSVPYQWRIYLDDLVTPKLTFTKNLAPILEQGTDAWVGFTAGSAFEWENHDIMNWSFSSKFSNVNYVASASDADTTGPASVSTVEYHPDADTNEHNLNAKIDTSIIPDRKTELWAKYYFPNNLSGGPYPVVVLAHGNHGTCGRIVTITGGPPVPRRYDDGDRYTQEGRCTNDPDPDGISRPLIAPSHRGYDYLANTLASWGYIVVSVNANMGLTGFQGNRLLPYLSLSNPMFPEYVNDPYLILARGRLILKHLQRLSEWNGGLRTFADSTTFGSGMMASETGWFGMKIRVGSQPVKVRSLGRMYQNGNGGTHRLRIVRASDGVVVAETSVVMSNWNHGQYKYADLTTPVTLSPDTIYYIGSEEYAGGDFFSRATVTASSSATIIEGVRSYNGTVWRNIGGNPYTFVPVDFIHEIDSSTPPELGVNLKGKIDLNNVGLMGHSRGGEGMRAAYNIYRQLNSPWKLRIRGSMLIKGIFEFAPTDGLDRNSTGGPPLLNADGTAWNVLLPACDGDVFNLGGVKSFDRMLNMTSESLVTQKSTYLVYGTNHNFYNTEWKTSENLNPTGCIGPNNTALFDPLAIESSQQRKTGSTSFMAFFRGNVGSGMLSDLNQNFNPRYNVPSSVSALTKVERGYIKSLDSTQTRVFNNLTGFAVSGNICSSSTVVCSDSDQSILKVEGNYVQLNPFFSPPFRSNHDEDFTAAGISWTSSSPSRYLQANWTGSGTSVNASSFQTLDFRVSRRRRDTPDNSSPVNDLLLPNPLNSANLTRFSVQLVMNDNSVSNAVNLSKYLTLDGPVGKPHSNPTTPSGIDGGLHPILRTVRIPLADFVGANLAQVKAVRFVFNDTSSGAIFLSNIRLSN